MPHKIAFILIDGIGDINVPVLGNMTPLMAADTPTLDAIAGDAKTRYMSLISCVSSSLSYLAQSSMTV